MPMPRYDVFLSHASADKSEVEHLARKLRDQGLEPFLDKWHLIPGERWQEALEEALDQSRTCAVFLGQAFGPWQNEEMRSALETCVRDAGFRVIPILLPGGREPGQEDLPRFLRRLTWVDFRRGLEDEEAFRRLLAGIRGQAPGPGSDKGSSATLSLSYRCMAPAREPFVQRGEYAKVRDALLAPRESAEDSGRATTVGITTAIHGAGGFGKTALAIELCHDERVREHHPDGILWTTMGEEVDDAGRLARVRDLIRWWTEKDPPAFETVSAAGAHLRQELGDKRVLLVVDDVWRPADVTPFQGLGPRAALLLTTRDNRTLPSESAKFHVDAMEVPEAVRLLASGLPDGTGIDLRELATRLGEWPLLLKIVNRQLRKLIQDDGLSLEQALQEVNEALDAEGLTVFDREDLESRGQAVARTVGASLRRLAGEDVSRFEQLAIFPENKDIPLRVLEKLWGLGSILTKILCDRLHDLSLLLRFDRQTGTIRLHHVIRAYLLKKGGGHMHKWHRSLLDACRPANGHWPDLLQDESYLWNHLIHHLLGAGQSDLCRSLLLDFHYLRSKLCATDVNALFADYSPFAENNEELRLVQNALGLSAHVLARNPAELPGQLLGRLLDRQETGIRSLLQASKGFGCPWLRPRKASLLRPGSALIRTINQSGTPYALTVLPDGRVASTFHENGSMQLWNVGSGETLQTLEGHSSSICAVAVLDRRRVISASLDGMLRVWDLESGNTLQTLKGHSHSVLAVAVLDSCRVISGSLDGTLRVWDLESGQTLQTLKGHSDWEVSAIAMLDSRRVIFRSSKKMLQVWDVEGCQPLQTLKGHSDVISAVAVLDSRRVVSASHDKTLRVWDAESGETLQILEGHYHWVSAVAVLDSHRVVSASRDRTLRVWNVESGQTLQTLEGHSDMVVRVAALGSRQVVSASLDMTLRVWDLESGQTLQTVEEHSAAVNAVAALDRRRVVSASDDTTLRVWNVESGETLQALEGHSNSVNTVAVLDSRHCVSGSSDGSLRVWDVEDGRTLQRLEGQAYWVLAVAALDRRCVVSGTSVGTLEVWDVESGQTLQILEHVTMVNAVAVLDRRRVVPATRDETLRVWDVESGQILQTLEGHSKSVFTVAVLDGRRVVSGSWDRTLRVWDVESGQSLQTFEGHSDSVYSVAVLDSRRVISGSRDETLQVWDVESGKVECLFTLDAPVTAVAVTPGSRTIVAGDSMGRVHFFDFVEHESP